MKVLLRFVVPILSFISMAACPVKADTFHFWFNDIANGEGAVRGTVILYATDTAATSVTVDTNSVTPTFGIGRYVVSDQISVADFGNLGSNNSSPALLLYSRIIFQRAR